MEPPQRPLLGVSLHAEPQFLALNRALIESAEVFEVAPEALWTSGCEPAAGAYETFAEIKRRSQRPMIAHGLAFSPGSAIPPPRRDAWLRAMARDQEVFDYLWWSDHLGFTDAAGIHSGLPLPLPRGAETVVACAEAFRQMQQVIATVAFENAASYFALGDPRDTPRLWADLCATEPRPHLLLDLHNVFVECSNFGIEIDEYLVPVPWDRVIEIHLSGGSLSHPDLLSSGRQFYLDAHDSAVPEPVWGLFERVLPRCSNLRAVIVEWVADAMDRDAAAQYRRDFDRAGAMLC